uniref:Phosphorylase superfamily protein n=1 Tax=Candidatus Kentrum sp. DK TaxID=2126562 RepID=A0A450RX11_9GAMM|nr:MAG: hypothetical protein BECKDK2373C_GA0170839_100614 [Candidatus Kentron sp. DK]VFJ47717.1 MAG: hypothetical protein BECKDK2373B_GA0170837_101824 [Candidatus Kentron sp. DK]
MESAAVAKVASETGKPFIVIRSIFDTFAMGLPVSALGAADPYGNVSMLKLISGLLKNPKEIIHYPALIRSSIRAEKGLRKVRELCGDELRCDFLSTVDAENPVASLGRPFFRLIPRWSFTRWGSGPIASMESKANMTY